MEAPDWWNRKDETSLARKLRLATIKSVYRQKLISEDEAKELLSAPLTPRDKKTFFDDSAFLHFESANKAIQPTG